MRLFNPRWRLLPLLCWAAVLAARPADACSVPVFRYALEHWPADPYEAVVFHRGPLPDAQRELARDFGPEGLAGRLHANFTLRLVDLDANPALELAELWRSHGNGALPWVLIRSPRRGREAAPLWSGPLSQAAAQPWLESPARREIIGRLAHGQSAVWLLLESGDREQDAAATQLLESRLAYLATTLALPKLDALDIANGLVSIGQDDLRLEFSVLRLSRRDAAEQPFVRILIGTEPDLDQAGEPIVFPVFGRGRALYALVGAGIKRETIDQAASFLIGKCSCQVKEQNPGVDLLFAANWNQLIKAHTNGLPDLPSFAELAGSAPVTVTISGSHGPEPTAGNPTPGWAWPAAAGMVAALAGGLLLLRLGLRK